MDNALKQRINDNQFVDKVRISMIYDEDSFQDLCGALQLLAQELRDADSVDKELALALYTIPVIIRNMYLSFDNHQEKPGIAMKLEDAWVELDALVTECLSS